MINNHNSVRWRRVFACCLFFLTLLEPLSAQDLIVSGKVTDGKLPISGANVLIKNTKNGVVSDFDGRFSITAKARDTLQISYLGYTTVTVPVQSRDIINISLQEDATTLGEIQINAGYYTTTDREKTASISRITAKEIEKQPVNNALDALQGRVTGLHIVSTTGLPGGGYTVRIRGQNSISAGNDPLYIIDGVPNDTGSLSSQSLSGSVFYGGIINPLNTLDPSTIATIEVLKDADATAIYGSRGANGVILITTKKGNVGNTKFIANVSTSIISVTKLRKQLNTIQYIAMRKQAFSNDGYTEFPTTAYDVNGTWNSNRYTNWQKKLIGNSGINNTYKLNISGGDEQTQFVIGSSFIKETTVFPFDFNYKRTTFFTNTNHLSNNNRFQIQLTANYGIDNNYLPSTDLTSISLSLPPNAPDIYDADGYLNWENNTWTNPYAALESNYRNNSKNLSANAVLSYKISTRWSVKTNLGYTNSLMVENQANPSTRFNPAFGVTSASSSNFINDAKRNSWIIEPQIYGNFELGPGAILFTIGATLQEQNFKQLTYIGFGYANDQLLDNISSAQVVYFNNDEKTQYRYVATYARLNYSLANKYILNLTGRRDGSSRFGPQRQFANFGAFGAAWIFSKEKLLQDSNWISFGKLRTSYGITGNDQIGDYQYLNTYRITDDIYNGNMGLSPSRLFNPNYAWELNRKIEVALEARFLQDLIKMEVAYYRNRSDNQLVGIPLPATTGFNSINANLNAVIDNTGWEASLNSHNISNKDFDWETTLQLSVPKTRLIEFDDLETSNYANYLAIGYPMNISKMYHLLGVNTESGNFEFEDYNGDETISATNDRQFIVDLTPKYFGNIINSLRYKNINLDFSFQYMKKMSFNEMYGNQLPGTMFNQPTSVIDNWQTPGDKSTTQQLTTGTNADARAAYSRFGQSNGVISDASFMRLKSLSLSYTPTITNDQIPRFTIYIQGQNLLTFTKFKGGDPEQIRGFLPPIKRISLGVKAEF